MYQNTNRIYNHNDLICVYHGLLNTASETTDWFVWNKPKGVRMIQITALGGGGGGGSGGAGALGGNRSGGAGGGSGAFSKVIIPALFLPDVLYIKPGAGGVGGVGVLNADGNIGSAGNTTYVSIFPDTVAGNCVCVAAGGTGGGAGNSAGASTAGTGGAAATQSTMPFGFLGITQLITGGGGGTGAQGGAGGTPAASPFIGGPMICGGAGAGGGVSTANVGQLGGNLIGITTIIDYPSTTTAIGTPGNNGHNYGLNLNSNPDAIVKHTPLVSTGGTGAGGQGSGPEGARGACGGFGSGGGGGGAINGTDVTGGNGGNGGPGFVMIVSTY